MTLLDADYFIDRLTVFAEAAGREVSSPQLVAMWKLIEHAGWTRERFDRALWAHTNDPERGRWVPTLADLIAAEGGREDNQALVLEAWGKVNQAMRQAGRYASVDFGRETNAAIRDCGGWLAVCTFPVEKIGILEATFRRSLTTYLAGRVGQQHLDHHGRYLAGQVELHNTGKGLPPPPLHRFPVGIEQRALGPGENT